MKLDRLVKTLRRDLAANPMKAGVLGVLLLGGLYFWGPLVWKWVGKKGTAAAPDVAVVSEPALAPAGVQPANGAAEQQETEIAWREIRSRRESDPLARSADFRPQWSRVFQPAAASAAVEEPQAEVRATKPAEVDPKDLGLVLQGVVIGPTAKKALISGQIYRELDSITVSQKADATDKQEDQQPSIEFRLLRVFRKMVEVERGGRIWQLQLASAEPEKNKPAEVQQAQQPKDVPTDEKAVVPK